MANKMVRIEEVAITADKEFTKDKWIEGNNEYGEIVVIDNKNWVVVETTKGA